MKHLSPELLDELLAQSADLPSADYVAGERISTQRSRLRLAADALLRRADGVFIRLIDAEPRTPVFCPFHSDERASAFTILSRRAAKGIHCTTCVNSFWTSDEGDYDFGHFERSAREAKAFFEAHQDRGPLFDQRNVHPGLRGCAISLVFGAPAPERLEPGFTFIKSPKGSGKTEALRRLVSQSKRVLLIGHRRSLIGQSSRRIGLESYLDLAKSVLRIGRLAVCLDSIQRIWREDAAEILILDESEQLLAHFLSETLDRRGASARWRLFLRFRQLVQTARSVVALDADLGWITYSTLTSMVADGDPSRPAGLVRPKPRRLWINSPAVAERKHIRVFSTQEHLLGQLKLALSQNRRCFVPSNSKAKVGAIAEGLAADFPEAKMIVITSDTAGRDDVRAFIASPATEALRYDLILASPSIGTGVDITFPDAEIKIDAVFGFFEPLINSHFDIDQQIGRVRHPGEVNVWIERRRCRFETNVDAVRSNLQAQGLYRDLLTGYDLVGAPVYEEADPLVEMAALIISEQLASKNDLKGHFIRHKESQGYTVEYVGLDPSLDAEGDSTLKLGRELQSSAYTARLISASPLKRQEFMRTGELMKGDEFVREDVRWAFARTRMELFYRQAITDDLVKLDDRGRFRACITRFERVLYWCHWAQKGIGPTFDPSQPVVILARETRYLRTNPAWPIFVALSLTPLIENGTFQTAGVIEGEMLQAFADFVTANKASIENQLGIEVRRDTAKKPVRMLNMLLDLLGLRLVNTAKPKKGGKRSYLYALDPVRLETTMSVMSLRKDEPAWPSLARRHGWTQADIADPDEDDETQTAEDESSA